MPAKQKPRKLTKTHKLFMAGATLLLVIAAAFAIKIYILKRYIDDAHQAEISTIRELVIQASDGLKTDAPVDAKTGDVYFPQSGLYLPAPSTFARLTYSYEPESKELSISSRAVFSKNLTNLYAAKNIGELFSAIPMLQSCQRGVTVSRTKLADGNDRKLRQTVQLSDGTSVYMYAEPQCTELSNTLLVLKDLKAY